MENTQFTNTVKKSWADIQEEEEERERNEKKVACKEEQDGS